MSGWLWAHSEAVLWFSCKYGKFGNYHSSSNTHGFCGSKVGLCLKLENSRCAFGLDFQAWHLQILTCAGGCAEMTHGLTWKIELALVNSYVRVRWYWHFGRGRLHCFESQTGQGHCLYRNSKTCFVRVWRSYRGVEKHQQEIINGVGGQKYLCIHRNPEIISGCLHRNALIGTATSFTLLRKSVSLTRLSLSWNSQ